MAALAAIVAVGAVALGFAHAGWFGGRRLTRIDCLADGRWRLVDARGGCVDSRLARSTRVAPGLVWLRWAVQRRSMLLARGDLPRRDLGRLVARLRLAGNSQPPATLATGGPPVR